MTENERRSLFRTAQIALIATAFCFSGVAGALGGIRDQFALTNTEVGMIGGAALWGLAIGQLVLSPLCDTLGLKRLMVLAFLLQVGGVAVMLMAGGFSGLLIGAALISIGNGAVEAACNPLVAALYPEAKATKLSHFHFWFPGGIALGGLLSFGLDSVGITAWQAKIALILIPAAIYGLTVFRQSFPLTETSAAGLKVSDALRAAFTSPLKLTMKVIIAITASIELGPNRWIPSVLESGGFPGILVLVLINGIMAGLRAFAEPVLARVAPTTVLFISSLLAAAGLLLIANAQGLTATLAASAVFACGAAFLWPMMVGVVSERLPRTGATGLGMIAAVGAAFVGFVTTPLMGEIADRDVLVNIDKPAIAAIAAEVERDGASLVKSAPARRQAEVAAVVSEASTLAPTAEAKVAFARHLIAADPSPNLTKRTREVLNPAENDGGLASFSTLIPFALFAAAVFLFLILADRSKGGYAAQVVAARAELNLKETGE